MYIGVDYYPEHWPRAKWENYAALMAKARLNIVRMAEFAWVFMEPEEEIKWTDRCAGQNRQREADERAAQERPSQSFWPRVMRRR